VILTSRRVNGFPVVVRGEMLIVGVKEMVEIQAGRKLADIFAEAEHDTELIGVHPHGETEKSDQRDEQDRKQHGEGSAHAAAWHGLPQFVLAAAQNLFQVRLLAWRAGTRAPGPSGAAFPATASALIAPRHDEFLS
jgi:hypothetical protein